MMMSDDDDDDGGGGRGEKGNKDSISSEICFCPHCTTHKDKITL